MKRTLILIGIGIFLFVGIAYAMGWKDFPMPVRFRGEKVIFESQTPVDLKNELNVLSGGEIDINSGGTLDVNGSVDFTGSTVTATGLISATHIADVVRHIPLPLGGFMFNNSGTLVSMADYSQVDDSVPNAVWSAGDGTPMLVTFRIPTDYSSGGVIRILCTQSATPTRAAVDFETYVNTSGSAADSAATAYTASLLSATVNPTDVTFTVTDTLSAGKYLTISIWKDNDEQIQSTNTTDLEVKAVEFYYTATQ